MVGNHINQLPATFPVPISFHAPVNLFPPFHLTFPQTTFLFQPASFPFPSKSDCVYLYYCSCPATAVTKPLSIPLVVAPDRCSLLTKVTDRHFRKASPEVPSGESEPTGIWRQMACCCMSARGQNSSQGWSFSFIVLMVFAGGVWIKPQSAAVMQN